MRPRTTRILATTAMTAALLGGASTVATQASPSNEAAALAGLKQQWGHLSAASKASTCRSYAQLGNAMVALTVTAAMHNATSARVMTQAEWTHVVTSYFQWACPGGRPR